jgi:Kdo2-lipid IVA lauroyltransferase/acyltransferase
MAYKIVYSFLYLLSLLPLRVLFIISDFVYVLLYHVFGYRREVVKNNLLVAFPGKTDAERKKIEKQFYKNFVDNFIETLKLLSGGPKFANKHFIADGSLMEEQFHKGNRCQFHLGHNFNWELANIAVSAITSYTMLMVYMPVKSKLFDRLMFKLRSSSGNFMLPATDMKSAMLPYREERYLLALVADQVPGDVSRAYWLNFFGRPTPFLRGPERGATVGNLSVFFAQIYKVKRGYYKLEYELFTEDPGSLPKGELTRTYARFLERSIAAHPEMWLWTHRRWKKEWKDEYAENWIDNTPHPS